MNQEEFIVRGDRNDRRRIFHSKKETDLDRDRVSTSANSCGNIIVISIQFSSIPANPQADENPGRCWMARRPERSRYFVCDHCLVFCFSFSAFFYQRPHGGHVYSGCAARCTVMTDG